VQPTLWVDVLPAEPQPDLGHALDALPGRVGGEPGTVDGADRCAVDAVGDEPVLGQDLEHADLDGAPRAPAGQDQGGHVLVGLVLVVLVGFGCSGVAGIGRSGGPSGEPCRPGAACLADGEPQGEDDEGQRSHYEHGEDDGEER
jgi:hypothetical protein